jgi:hypothetical protein
MIPFWGWTATGGKFVKKAADKVGDIAGQTTKQAGDLLDAGKNATDITSKRYDGPKPKYSVHPSREKGSNYMKGIKTPLPKDAEDVYKHAIPSDGTNPRHWYGKNKDGQIYVFHNSNDGTVHFSKILDTKSSEIPPYVRTRLGL